MTSLSFVHSAYLFALLAVAVPIIIHLINRKKAIHWPFAAMEFLLRSHLRVERRLKIKQFLLLLLRMLIVAAIAFGFAKPFLKKAQGNAPSMPKAIVFILDDSFSMQYRSAPHALTLFEEARRKLKKILSHLRGEDLVALLHGSLSEKTLPFEQTELTFDKRALRRKVDRWKPSFRKTDLREAIDRASLILAKKKGFQQKIIILSDFARHTFSSNARSLLALPSVELIPIRPSGGPENVQNVAITNIVVQPAPFIESDAYRFTVFVKNFGNRARRHLLLKLHLNGRVKAQGFISLKARAALQKQFVIRLRLAGLYSGFAEIERDPLEGDNRFFFTLKARRRPKVLLVNGDPRTIPYLDELFYLERALQDLAAPFSVKTQLASAHLPEPSAFDVIFLANVARLPKRWLFKLKRFVKEGGGLFISVGNQVNPFYYNRHFADLLPRHLRHKAVAAQRPDGTGVVIQRYFGEIQGSHPIFRTLARDGIIFQTARVSKLMLVQTRQKSEQGTLLWRYSHGPPALLERVVGKGKVLLLTTTIDRDWTDLPIRSFFQPWIQRSIAYLAGGSYFSVGKILYIDQKVTMKFQENLSIKVKGPHGGNFWLRASGSSYLFSGGAGPGLYRFFQDGKPLKLLPLAVNVDPEESDVLPLSLKRLKKIGKLANSAQAALETSSRMWPMVFFLLFLFFFLETAILHFL